MRKVTGSRRTAVARQAALLLWLGFSARAAAEAPPAAAPRAASGSVLEAESYAARAYVAYMEKKYSEAAALYRKAYDAAPSADALYNTARVYDLGLRDRPLAMAAYRRFLLDPGAAPDRIRVATARLAALREGELALAATEAAELQLGEAERRTVKGADAQVVAPASSSERFWSASRVAAVAAGSAGIVSLGVGAAFGAAVLSNADTANALCVGNRCSSQRGVDAARAASTSSTVATVGVSLGVGLLATGAALWIASARGDETAPRRELSVEPRASASELGMMLAGGW